MREATARCMRNAFCLESMAHVRYRIYAEKAEDGRFPSIARLFRAIALSRYIRSSEAYRLVGGLIGTNSVNATVHFTMERTMDNLESARNAEAEAADEVFWPYLAVAEAQQEMGAVKYLKRSIAVCRQQAAIMDTVFLKTKRAAEEPCVDSLYVCQSCGSIAEGAAPEQCPVCSRDSTGFTLVQ